MPKPWPQLQAPVPANAALSASLSDSPRPRKESGRLGGEKRHLATYKADMRPKCHLQLQTSDTPHHFRVLSTAKRHAFQGFCLADLRLNDAPGSQSCSRR
eukprot:4934217-Amphidinium_carterae.1